MSDNKIVAHTFARYSYQFNSNKPYYASKTKLFVDKNNCDKAMKSMAEMDYHNIKEDANEEDWAHKYIDIDECSDEADYEIRGYDTEDNSHDYVTLYRYISYPVYYIEGANCAMYRGFVIIAAPETIDGRIEFKFRIISPTKTDLDFLCDTVSEAIDRINSFLTYMDTIGDKRFNQEVEE